MGLDRPALRATPGLRFWRLLGTGRGATMTLSADLRRWALFAVWEDEAALDASSAASPVAARWAELAREAYHVRLAPLRARRLGRANPLPATRGRAPATGRSPSSPARRSARRGCGASTARSRRRRPTSRRDRGCSPRSGWASGRSPARRPSRCGARSTTRAATPTGGRHRDVVRRTRAERWYPEELFARFRPTAPRDVGRPDPLAGALSASCRTDRSRHRRRRARRAAARRRGARCRRRARARAHRAPRARPAQRRQPAVRADAVDRAAGRAGLALEVGGRADARASIRSRTPRPRRSVGLGLPSRPSTPAGALTSTNQFSPAGASAGSVTTERADVERRVAHRPPARAKTSSNSAS